MFIQCSLNISFQGLRNAQKQKSKQKYFIYGIRFSVYKLYTFRKLVICIFTLNIVQPYNLDLVLSYGLIFCVMHTIPNGFKILFFPAMENSFFPIHF